MDLVFCITNDSWDTDKIKGNGMKSKIRQIFLLVPISIIVFFAYVISQSQNEASQPLNLELPEFQLQTLDDKTLSEKDISSGTYLINVWASWCITCRVEHPFLIDLKDKGVPIIGLNYKDNKDDAINWLKDFKSPYEISIHDFYGTLALDLGVTGAPETYLLKDGIIVRRHIGELNIEKWRQDFEEFFQKIFNCFILFISFRFVR